MEIITAIGTILGIVVVMLFRDFRDGKPLFKKTKKNNENGDESVYNRLESIQTELSIIGGNHLDHVQKGIDTLHSKHDQTIRILDKMTYIIEDIKNNGIECRK